MNNKEDSFSEFLKNESFFLLIKPEDNFYSNTSIRNSFFEELENFEKFLLIVSINTGIDINEISYISPLWTYKLLTLLSVLMIIGELFAFLN